MKRNTNLSPLRKIVRFEPGVEVLECGHGYCTWNHTAARRRCAQCGREELEIVIANCWRRKNETR
jgi:hypothetical protein